MQFLFHGVGHYHPNSKPIGPARWPHHDVIVIQHGEIALTVGGHAMQLCAEDAVVIPPGHTFVGNACSDAATIWVLHYSGFDGAGRETISGAEPAIIRHASARPLVRKAMKEFSTVWKEQQQRGREARLLGEWLLLQFARVARNKPDRVPPRLRDAVAYFKAGNFHLEVAGLAHVAGYSPSRFRKLLRDHYGVSPQQFIFRARVEEGKRLLEETFLPIKEIAAKLGYADVAAFHRAFRRETSFTPALWRWRHSGIA